MADVKALQERSESLEIETRAFIDGKFVSSVSKKTFADVNPANGKLVADISECDQEDVEVAVAAARKAFVAGTWSKLAPRDRKVVLLKLADLLERDAEEFAILEALDTGKPVADALEVDVPDAIATLRWHAEAIDKIYDSVSPTSGNIVSMVVREPIGVVGAVIPWNFPIAITAMKLGPVLAGGNSLVVKPAEQTPLTAIKLASLANEAGIPAGVFNVVPGYGETAGKALGLHPDVDCVSFTGSTEVGRYFLKYSAESNIKRIILELGGKSPAIVMNDVEDFAPVIEQVCAGILFSQGENCSAGSRLLIHEDIKERFLKELLVAFDDWKVGNPFVEGTRVGAMIDEKHMKRVLGYIETGKSEGAKVIYGGKRLLEETNGFYVEPTIFDNVTNDMTIAQEEIFGPVLSVITFKTTEEAIAIANDTVYGLAASLYTGDLRTAHTVSRAIQAGTVSVNCFSEGDQAVPFGGFKQSGFGGREKSLAAHDQYLQTKTIWMQLD
ncbi:aldehyde dehydrogenase [Neokomagataea thailandica NBRC 106555]|uniref:Aldehyde dehydrogenase n=2 Tax=Neokomagataea TaxID=1223423 RepID=A0A4Y6V879_9PROT|nr:MULTISPECIES: aldehyde dehydrogenase [Neokomagataea]QDH24565.1 aldehyde dehydrogenase [Neokomagataea tanensis]GBR52424.1 aldehyde dehydrogenase [Neokomagataea thailandica NBRC 106555]